MAPTTQETGKEAIGPSALIASAGVRQGAHVSSDDGPKRTTSGTPNAAAACAGPESLPRNRAASHIRRAISASLEPTTVRHPESADISSDPAPMNTGSRSRDWLTYRASSRKLDMGQVFSGVAANG